MGFKERLKELRTKKGITQETLAASLDIPESTIRRLESSDEGLPRRERLERIADFFNVKIDYLLGRTDDPSPSSSKDEPNIKSANELLQEIVEDPDDYLFFDDYLGASEEEKKIIRREWYELKKQLRANKGKTSKPPSLYDITESIGKDEK